MEVGVTYGVMAEPATQGSEAEKLQEDLLDYCEQGTYAIFVIQKGVERFVKQ